eukprot:750036-Hanusia_phi.AAC.1
MVEVVCLILGKVGGSLSTGTHVRCVVDRVIHIKIFEYLYSKIWGFPGRRSDAPLTRVGVIKQGVVANPPVQLLRRRKNVLKFGGEGNGTEKWKNGEPDRKKNSL